MTLAGGQGPSDAGQSGLPTSLNDFMTPTQTIATITATPRPVTSIDEVQDWKAGLWMIIVMVFILILVSVFNKKH